MRTHDIHIETANGIGFIALDRPQALNALTTTMLHAIRNALGDWRHDHAIRAVIVYSPHPRAFCAGGDIRFLYEAAKAASAPRSTSSSPTNTGSTTWSSPIRSRMSR